MGYPISNKKEIIMWICVYPNWQTNFYCKSGKKRSFYYETKASMSFIPIRRICLWFLIMKRKEIITWIHFYPNWWTNFESKKWWAVKFFLWNQSLNSFILAKGMNLWCPIIKRKEIILWICVYPNWKMNFNSKNARKKSFSYET